MTDAISTVLDEISTAMASVTPSISQPSKRRAIRRTRPTAALPGAPITTIDGRSERNTQEVQAVEAPGHLPYDTHSPCAGGTNSRATPRQIPSPRTRASRKGAIERKAPSKVLPPSGNSSGVSPGLGVHKAHEALLSRDAKATIHDGHLPCENRETPAVVSDDRGHFGDEAHSLVAPVIAEIVQLWRMRQRWHRAEKSLILQGKAVCRSWTGGDKDEAAKLYDRAAEGEGDPMLLMALAPFLRAQETFRPERLAIEKRLRKLARSLPVWEWAGNVKGFGDLNLAAIVGEAGDVGSYKTPSALWKRMGLAVIDGERQRRVADAEKAIRHGYNPERRCVAYLLGDTLIKGNGEGVYRTTYLARKELEGARVATKAHAHNRAARYMTKRCLADLWSAWRAAGSQLSVEPHRHDATGQPLPEAA